MTPNMIRMRLIGLQDFVNNRIDGMESDADPSDVVACLTEISRESGRLAVAISIGTRSRRENMVPGYEG